MYESMTKRLACRENAALLGLYLGQYLTVVFGPALIAMGFTLWNALLVVGGVLTLRLFFLLSRLQADVMEEIGVNERRARFIGPPSERDKTKHE